MRARGTRLAGLMAVAMLCGATGVMHSAPAMAQAKPAAANEDPKQQAVKLYKDAQDLFDKGDYEAALPLYVKADELVPGAAPKYKIALSYDKLGKKEEAVAAYQKFIDSDPGEKYTDEVAEAKKRIEELQAATPGKVTVKVTPSTVASISVTVDGKPVEGMELELEPGKHTVVVTAEGHQPVTEVVTVESGEARELPVALTPIAKTPSPKPKPAAKPKAEPKEEEDNGGTSNVPAYVTLGIAGAGIILGTVFGVQALQKKNEFDDRIEAMDATPTELQDIADDAERAALIADMSFGVALTFGITGAVLLFSNTGDDAEETEAARRPVLLPYAGPTGAGMAATWSF